MPTFDAGDFVVPKKFPNLYVATGQQHVDTHTAIDHANRRLLLWLASFDHNLAPVRRHAPHLLQVAVVNVAAAVDDDADGRMGVGGGGREDEEQR